MPQPDTTGDDGYFYDPRKGAQHTRDRIKALESLRHITNNEDDQTKPNFQHLTISDDQSTGSDLNVRRLAALKISEPTPGVPDLPVKPTRSEDPDSYSSDEWYQRKDPPGGPIAKRTNKQVNKAHPSMEYSRRSLLDRSEGIMQQPRTNRKRWSELQPNGGMSSLRPLPYNNNFLDVGPEPSHGLSDNVTNDTKCTNNAAVESPEIVMSLEELKVHIGDLQTKVRELESAQDRDHIRHYRVLYRIWRGQHCEVYLDHPQWTDAGRNFQSRQPIRNFDLFVERNKSISFIVFRDFNQNQKFSNRESLIEPEHFQETIFVVSRELDHAVSTIFSEFPAFTSLLHRYRATQQLSAPYLMLYHTRGIWAQSIQGFSASTREHIGCLTNYILSVFGEEYSEADKLLSQGKISAHFLKFLFKPGDILVHTMDMKEYQGCIANSWPGIGPPSDFQAHDTESEPDDDDDEVVISNMTPNRVRHRIPHQTRRFQHRLDLNQQDVPNSPVNKSQECKSSDQSYESQISTWSWTFSGKFVQKESTFTLKLPPINHSGHRDDVFNIIDLGVYPLAFAAQSLQECLQRRGQTFWECRKRSLVSYQAENGNLDQLFRERYMIDFGTFRSLHPSNEANYITIAPRIEIDEKLMESRDPPDEHFHYLVPNQIKGYNLRTKKWHDLKVDWIHPVAWNENIFETLVLDRKTKELIQALVSKQIAAQKSTDVVASKGNGLIMLLHGGPGTGKTLTAEGVAEIAKKPLYRVTCGDVGTKAEDVEKYLESVLHLGKIWDCVVLLDEAEVFLEQRTLDNLQRNALVSVFLRVLEYHEGILILTSNRVGTFDEAFRSRIQIAIHYPALGVSRRRKIWNNFIDRLESFKDDTVDVEDLRGHIEDLQKFEMNGRQIRNAITTARQYAEWKGEKMDYEYLKDVVDVASKFDAYSTKLKGGYTDDQLAEEEGVR